MNKISKKPTTNSKLDNLKINADVKFPSEKWMNTFNPYIKLNKSVSQAVKSYSGLISTSIKPYTMYKSMLPKVESNLYLGNYTKNLNKLNILNFRAPKNVLLEEYINQSKAMVDNFSNVIKPFKIGIPLEKSYSQIATAADIFQNLVTNTYGKKDENIEVAKILMQNGWVTSEFFYNNILKDNYKKSENEIIDYVENFYTENQYERFFRIFDLVIDGFEEQNLNEGYRKLLIKIKKIIKQDFNNFDLFINTVFSIIEYVCCYKFNILYTNDYIKEKSIKTARQKYANKNGCLTKIDIMSMFGVLKSWWKKINFKGGLEHTEFGRSTVEHGRYDPRRYKRTDFIKMIIFIFNVLVVPVPKN